MKTLLSIVEVILAIPLSIITVPFLLAVIIVKMVKGKPASTATIIEMDASPVLTRNVG